MTFNRIKAPNGQRGPLRGLALAGIATLAIAVGAPALAQEAAPEATPETTQQAAPGGEGSDLGNWIKICTEGDAQNPAAPPEGAEQPEAAPAEGGEESCLVTQEVRTETGEFLASVSVRDNEGQEAAKTLMVAVPPGTLIQPGLRIQVDEGEQESGRYVICLPNACYGELEIEDAFIDQMKGGENLVVSVINNQGQAVGIGLTLMGFTAGWDGPPVDTDELAQERQRLQEQLQRRAADARERLLQEEGGEGEGGEGEAAEQPEPAAPPQ